MKIQYSSDIKVKKDNVQLLCTRSKQYFREVLQCSSLNDHDELATSILNQLQNHYYWILQSELFINGYVIGVFNIRGLKKLWPLSVLVAEIILIREFITDHTSLLIVFWYLPIRFLNTLINDLFIAACLKDFLDESSHRQIIHDARAFHSNFE